MQTLLTEASLQKAQEQVESLDLADSTAAYAVALVCITGIAKDTGLHPSAVTETLRRDLR